MIAGGDSIDLRDSQMKRGNDPFYKFEPHAKQLSFIMSTKRTIGLVGANRSGKSECGGWLVAAFARGEHPTRKTPRGAKIWIVGLDEKMLRDVAWKKMLSYIPKGMIAELRERAGDYYLLMKNGSEVWGKSCASGWEKFQAQDLDWAHFDEEPSDEAIWRETRARLVDRMGTMSIAMTPILGSPWFYTQVYKSKDPDTCIVGVSMWDNPYIPDENKRTFVRQLEQSGCSEDEIRVRVGGEYILWGGRNVFNADVITKRLTTKEEPPIFEGAFVETGALFHGRPLIRIWDFPRSDHAYVMGADAAQGIQADAKDSGGDFSAAHVYDLNERKQVAEVHGRIDPDAFAMQLYHLGRMFNDATIAVEAEKFGVAVLKELSYEHYPSIYMQRVRGKRFDDDSVFMGWAPDVKNKVEAIKDLTTALREGWDGIRSHKLLNEMIFYVYDERGRANAMRSHHDDLVTSYYITMAVAFESRKMERAQADYPVGSAGELRRKILWKKKRKSWQSRANKT